MATLTIRNLPEGIRRALKLRAAQHNRSMEAEAREILTGAVGDERDFIASWLESATELRGDFEVPARSAARQIDLS